MVDGIVMEKVKKLREENTQLKAKIVAYEEQIEKLTQKMEDVTNAYNFSQSRLAKADTWQNREGRPKKIFAPADIQAIFNHKKMGHSNYAIAEMYQVSEATIRRILKANSYIETNHVDTTKEVNNAIKKALYDKMIHEQNLVKNKHYHDFYNKLKAGEIEPSEIPKITKEVEDMKQMTWQYKNFEFFLNETSPNGKVNVELNKNFVDSFDIGYVTCDYLDFKGHCDEWLKNNEENYTVKSKNDSRGITEENKGTSRTAYGVEMQTFKI